MRLSLDLSREIEDARRRALAALEADSVVRGPVLLDGPANYQRGWEAVGGWLALSADRLAFVSHGVNCWVGQLLIPTHTIRRAWPGWTRLFGVLPVFPNSVAVETADGRVYRFVVADRQKWLAALRGPNV